MSEQNVLAIIGGSGLYAIDELTAREQIRVETPYGAPSDVITRGQLGETTLLFLPRHGRGHVVSPSGINYRANICALKKLGATHLVSISAVGSMREEIKPGDFVVADQFIDFTKQRASSFFDSGLVSHVGFADPVCGDLSAAVAAAAESSGVRVHRGGTYLCIEGPQFSTRSESRLYRSWDVSVIGMTAMPEAKLAREAELPYALLALATDYDCWHESEEDVTVEAVLATMRENVAHARVALVKLARSLPDAAKSPASTALGAALLTAPDAIVPEARTRLDWLVGKYLR